MEVVEILQLLRSVHCVCVCVRERGSKSIFLYPTVTVNMSALYYYYFPWPGNANAYLTAAHFTKNHYGVFTLRLLFFDANYF